MKTTFITALVLGFSFCAGAGEAAATPVPNAALKYWMAFESLGKVNEAENKILSQGFKAPATEQRDNAIHRFGPALKYMQRGAAIPACDWGGDPLLDGPAMELPYLGKLRSLARVACLTARGHYDVGHHREAIIVLIDAMKMARHTGADHLLISRLVETAIDTMAIDALARMVPNLPAEQLKFLSEQLDNLPPPNSLAETVRIGEKATTIWMRKAASEGKLAETLRMFQNVGDDWTQNLAAMFVTPKLLETQLDKCDSIYEDYAKAFEAPFEESVVQLKKIEAKIADSGFIAKMMMPALLRCRISTERETCQRALLKAGVRIQLEGEAAIKSAADPYAADKMLDYRKTQFGFELTSQFDRATPVKLQFGFDPNEKPQETSVKPPTPPKEDLGQF